jgi:hypothetical protein
LGDLLYGFGETLEHTNYCRQMMTQFKALSAVPSVEPEKKAVVDHVIDLCRASQKFMLPPNGELLPDAELRALDDSVPLRLPHPFVALEFTAHLAAADGATVPAKRVVFCREDEDGIYVRPAAYLAANGFWMVKRDACIPTTNYLDRSDPRCLKVIAEYQEREGARDGAKHVMVVLGFLNALACSNVRVQASVPKKAGKKIKAALPFDTYHVLTIEVPGRAGERTGLGGPHRSPREHLRRGHIRRLADSRKIWVNATVVAAGHGGGTVTKDYAIRAAA